jgi:hypothetical protein
MPTTPNMLITETDTWLSPDYVTDTPADAAADGLGGLLDRLCSVLARPAGTVLIGGQLARQLGFTGDRPPGLEDRIHSEVLHTVRTRGWRCATLRPWMIMVKNEGSTGDRVIHVGVLPWLSDANFPLWSGGDHAAIMARMEDFARLLGVPYHGDHSGLVGVDLARLCAPPRSKSPLWVPKTWDDVPPASMAVDTPDRWQRSHSGKFEHGYDVNTQYLSASGVVTLALDKPRHQDYRHGSSYEIQRRNDPGYYLIRPPAWQFGDRMPHPCGRVNPGYPLWVTAPTLDLCYDLADRNGILAEPEVLESWTAPGTRVLREWSELLARAVRAARADDVLFDAVKGVYKRGRGMIDRGSPRIHRPDWSAAIEGAARANLWRKVWAYGRAADRWPIRINADAVWYASNDPDPMKEWPITFKQDLTGVQGGAWKVYGSKEVQAQ